MPDAAATRLSVEDRPELLRVIIPRRPNGSGLVFLGLWLVIWIPAGAYGLKSLLHGEPASSGIGLVIWGILWVAGILFSVASLLWQLGGRELLTLDATTLTYRAVAFGLGTRRVFPASDIRNLRLAAAETTLASTRRRGRTMPPWATSYGTLAFDCGGRTLRFAPSLDEPDAKVLWRVLHARLANP